MDYLNSILTTISTILLVFLIASISYLIIKIFIGKSIRNPRYPPVIGTVFHQLFYFKTLYDRQTEDARKYGTFRLLSPVESELYTTDPRIVQHILKTNFSNYSKGHYNQEIVKDLFGEGIFAVDGDKWRHQRKLASFEFSTRVLRDFSCQVFRTNGSKLVGILSRISVENKVFDMQDLLMRSTLDSIFKVGFGVELNCMDGTSKEGSKFMKAFDDLNELTYWRYVDPLWKLKRFFNVYSEASLKKNVKVVNDFVNSLITTKRIQQENDDDDDDLVNKEDILSRFLDASKKEPEGMNDKYLRDIILNFMIAGKDTSANTLSWFFYMLCKNPQIQDKIEQEINEIVGWEPTNVHGFMERVTEEALQKTHYLHATLTETLRLYPAVPVDGRCADNDDILPDGYEVRKNDGVYYMAYAMGRMESNWGEDAMEFKPERWIKDGVFQPESSFKFIAFHAGPRICLGKEFAYRQMKIVSMALIRYFRFKLADEAKKVTYRTMFTLHIAGGLHLYATPRDM